MPTVQPDRLQKRFHEDPSNNGDGDLDWPELQEGMTAYWAKVSRQNSKEILILLVCIP